MWCSIAVSSLMAATSVGTRRTALLVAGGAAVLAVVVAVVVAVANLGDDAEQDPDRAAVTPLPRSTALADSQLLVAAGDDPDARRAPSRQQPHLDDRAPRGPLRRA